MPSSRASHTAQQLDTTVVSVTSALQRARATIEVSGTRSTDRGAEMDAAHRGLLARYVGAFEAHDIDGLTSLIKEDATQSGNPLMGAGGAERSRASNSAADSPPQ